MYRNKSGQLILVLGLGLAMARSASGQARPISRAQLPANVQAQLDRGALVRLTSSTPDTVPRTATAPMLRPGEALAARTGERATLSKVSPKSANHTGGRSPATKGMDSTFALPFTFVGFDREGKTPAYQPVYIPEGGLRYAPAADEFEGDFLIRLDLVDGSGDSVSLARSIGLTFGGDADSITPASLTFGYTGGMYERVRVVARSPHDSLRVQVVPQFDPRGVSIWLSVQPALTFERPPASIQGYGIETVTLVIGMRGVTSKDSIDVSVSADRGILSSNQLRIGPTGGVVTLRSASGLGPATVRVVSATLGTAETTIDFALPVRFALAALLGGVLGAVYAQTQQKKQGRTSSMVRQVVGAVLGAVLATAIYSGLGVSLLPLASKIPLGNELAVFAFAAFGAMVGIKVPSGAAAVGAGGAP
jgi:hypothetical protein